ncbi:hypothetical protein [Marinifilum sp.]|uniref:hypothetical protein n=1 Tax=Marinifilum sp. TaxID=2033137 RepID=UPI003BA8D0BB
MPCKSPSLEKVVQKSENAKKQIEQLNKQLISLEASNRQKFEAKMAEHAQKAKIQDFRQLIFNSAIKTEYSHEFSLDKIAPVIAATLEAVAQSLTGSVLEILTSADAVSSYSDLVVSISEAAKSKSSASNNLAFSANRIAPGIYAFLSANSVSIKDEQTFGEESVTSTSLIYNLSNSIDDLKNAVEFETAYLDAELLVKFKHIQIGYADELAHGTMTLAVWQEKNLLIENIIKGIQARIDSAKFKSIIAKTNDINPISTELLNPVASRRILEHSVMQFENRGSLYKDALENAKGLLNKPIFSL